MVYTKIKWNFGIWRSTNIIKLKCYKYHKSTTSAKDDIQTLKVNNEHKIFTNTRKTITSDHNVTLKPSPCIKLNTTDTSFYNILININTQLTFKSQVIQSEKFTQKSSNLICNHNHFKYFLISNIEIVRHVFIK